jgi:3-hydroxy-3-methylglutaryl CoA synthase
MVGITSYGAYVPVWRLGQQTKGWEVRGEKAVANFDEDSVTMAVAAALDALSGVPRESIDALYFASTTPPYGEKQSASTVAAACDLRRDVFTADCADSLKSGTAAMRMAADAISAGSAKRAIVTAADSRMTAPRSEADRNTGDGGAALILGDTDVAAVIEGYHSVSDEMLGTWRSRDEGFFGSWEDRFVLDEGYFRVLPEAVSGLMKKYNVGPKDFAKAVFDGPAARRHQEMGRKLGFAPEQIQDPLFGKLGDTGTAFPLMLLVAALEDAKPGDRILLGAYGDGADCLILKVTDQIEKIRARRGMKVHLEHKRMIGDYAEVVRWRDLMASEAARRPSLGTPSPAVRRREADWIFPLQGAKCKSCGTVQYPPQRVCTNPKCHAKDNFEPIRLSDKRAELYTYAMDYIAGSVDVPLVISIINFEGGGRMLSQMTDRVPDEVKVGMPLEMSFRKLRVVQGIHNYYWKPIPIRDQVGQ